MLKATLALFLILPIIAPAADTLTEDIYRDQHPIEDGAPADQNRYPFLVRITNKGPGAGLCTGSIIQAGWVLTAAHCLDETEPARLTVEHRRSKTQVRRVLKIVIHPEYDNQPDRPGVNDAALLALNAPFEFPAVPVRVLTPEEERPLRDPEGFPAFVLGYGALGRREGAPFPEMPHGVQQLMRFPADCRALNIGPPLTLPDSDIHDGLLCAGYVPDVGGIRAGDSGGPLVVQIDGATALVGIASALQPKFYSAPAFFTRAAWVQPWIKATTGTPTTDPDPSPRTIPHIAQGQGWGTWFYVMNTCADPVGWDIDFFGGDGRRKGFYFGSQGDPGVPYSGARAPELKQLGHSTITFFLPASGAGDRLLQGFGRLVDDAGGCVKVDVEYQQRTDRFTRPRYATIPLQRMADAWATWFTPDCQTGLAIAGAGGPVRIEAYTRTGEPLESVILESVHHTAFQLGDMLPQTQTYGSAGLLRITGHVSVLALDFCAGKLEQFRLPHPIQTP